MSTSLDPDRQSPPVEKLAYKLSEASTMLGLSEITIRRLIKRGALRPNRAVRHIIFSRKELERFLSEGG